MTKQNLETLAYRLKDLSSLRNLFSELNFDFADDPVNKGDWHKEQKKIVKEARIVARKNDYSIYYIQTQTDSLRAWKGIATKIIQDNHGFAMVCSHNPSGFKWAFSSLSKEFSKSFIETRHVPIEINPDAGIPKTFVEFLEKIKVDKKSKASSIIAQVSKAFDSFAIQIHEELTVNVFEALKILSEGIIFDESNNLILNEQTLKEIREPIFILLYRIIFILYAEDRGVFPIDDKTYHDKYSLKWIKKEWVLNSTNQKNIKNYEIQKRLTNLFRLIERGSEDLGYKKEEFFMRPYYGRIFDKKLNSKLENWTIPNSNFLKALSLLTRTVDKKKNYFFLDYSALETRHLGSIYEHLLEFHLHVENDKISKLPEAKDRKTSGSYYTSKHIVDYVVKNSIEPLIKLIAEKHNNKYDQIEKILSLKIIDPAMGSGHFLVGAVEYMAKRLCEIEFGEIDERQYNERKRDVVRRCIYGVDSNSLAVDLAKLSLWLETLYSEKPLSFLSAHLKCGNSLIGESIGEVFDNQMTLLESEKTRNAFKKNLKNFLMFETLEDDSASAVKLKLEKYSKMRDKGTIYYDLKFLLDCKMAGFFGIDLPNLGDYRAKVGENSLDFYSDPNHLLVRDVTDEMNFFHWDLEFPQVFYNENGDRKVNAGFDVVIGNPPWQILKTDVDEFFSLLYERYNPNSKQKFSKLSKDKKNAFVKKMLLNEKIYNDYNAYKMDYKKQMNFFNKSNRYKHQASMINGKRTSSDINLYKLFTERSHQILKDGGYCGLVVPSGIYSDQGSKGLRELLLEKNNLNSIFAFTNKKNIFKDVDSRYKFCILIFGKGGRTNKFLASFYLEDDGVLKNYEKIAYKYDAKQIQTISPDALSFLECKNESEFDVFKKLYEKPLLGSKQWNFHARREFDMSNNSKLFHTTKVGYPLYEGKMINMFTNLFAPPRYWIDKNEGSDVLETKELNRMKRINKHHQNEPRIDVDEYRLVWRSIANAGDTRTFITTILPPHVFLGNSLNYSSPMLFDGHKYTKPISYPEMFYLCAMFNSFQIDFILRHKISRNINIFYIMELPIPRYDEANELHRRLMENAAKLICTTDEYEKLLNVVNVTDSARDPEQRINLEAQINAASAKVYNLTKEDLELIMENFPNINNNLKKLTIKEFELIEFSEN